ncbi:MAG: hypothetical protein H0T54_07610, partial [Geodermatophilaceae bacterium]|nr:hypothetical protein [Geodermatophilaceae bacterium]
ATLRTETRGCHWREDYPDTDPAWRGRIEVTLDDDGILQTDFRALEQAASATTAAGVAV